jgi:DNA-binding CsgD family transcriptional regulator
MRIDQAAIPGWIARRGTDFLVLALLESGDVTAAWQYGADGLAQAQQAGDLRGQASFLGLMAIMDQRAGRLPEAGARLRESLELATWMGDPLYLLNCLDSCGHLCAATHRWAEAVTDVPQDEQRRQAPLRAARQALGHLKASAAEERGTAMTAATATEFAIMLTTVQPPESSGAAQLSPRERELVTLVAQGRTNAQIASQLYISVRTVGSHLDRIRDKTGCRRRADLTRLALEAGLV